MPSMLLPRNGVCTSHSLIPPSPLQLSRLALANLLHRTIIIDMNIQALGLVVHRAHAIGLEDAVLLGEVVLRESL